MEVRVLSSAPRNSADLLRSELLQALGFEHGFNLRTGGASTASPYASFNLGRAVGDDPEQVAENHRRFARAVGYAYDALYEVSQVHGPDAVAIAAGDEPGAVRRREADALILPSRSEGQPVSILEAFCDRTLVVAANIPELTELVSHGRTGLLFAANDATSLAQAIVSARVLATGERRAILDRARLRYEARFSLQAMIDGYLSIYGAQAGRRPAMRRAG